MELEREQVDKIDLKIISLWIIVFESVNKKIQRGWSEDKQTRQGSGKPHMYSTNLRESP